MVEDGPEFWPSASTVQAHNLFGIVGHEVISKMKSKFSNVSILFRNKKVSNGKTDQRVEISCLQGWGLKNTVWQKLLCTCTTLTKIKVIKNS